MLSLSIALATYLRPLGALAERAPAAAAFFAPPAAGFAAAPPVVAFLAPPAAGRAFGPALAARGVGLFVGVAEPLAAGVRFVGVALLCCGVAPSPGAAAAEEESSFAACSACSCL